MVAKSTLDTAIDEILAAAKRLERVDFPYPQAVALAATLWSQTRESQVSWLAPEGSKAGGGNTGYGEEAFGH